jgi:hypothetical protein
VYKVGFIREKERLQLEHCSGAWKLVARCSATVKAGVFMDVSHWPWICGLSQVNWFGLHLYWGKGNNLESILFISPVADLSDSISPLGCRNAVYNSLSGCRNDIALHGRWDTHSSALSLQTQQFGPRALVCLWSRRRWGF